MTQTATINLLTGDYPDRLNQAWAAAQAALKDESPKTLADGDPYGTLKDEYEALKAEAIAAGKTVKIKAVGRREWRRLKLEHPPRTDADEETVRGDRMAGVNVESVEDDLVYVSLLEPEFESRAAYDEWANELSEGEFQTILQRAWKLANIAQYDPKSLPASPIRSSDANSE